MLYLPEPPKDFQAMHDFRRLPGKIAGRESPELRFEIRRTQNRRELALELYELSEIPIPSLSLDASLSEDPEEIGKKIPATLGGFFIVSIHFLNVRNVDKRHARGAPRVGRSP